MIKGAVSMLYILRAKKRKTLIVLILITVLYVLTQTHISFADTNPLKIETDPASGAFVFTDVVPGDSVSGSIKVQNTGTASFNYAVSSRKLEGNTDLFNHLTIQIVDDGTVISNSKLNSLTNFYLGVLAVGGSKDYTFIIGLPLDAGDNLQRKSTTVAFDFIASAQSGGNPPPDNVVNPTDPPDIPNDTKTPEIPVTPEKPGLSTQPEQPTGQPTTPTETHPPGDPASPSETPSTDAPVAPEQAVPTDPAVPGIELPKTSSPWYNLLLISGIFVFLSLLLLGIVLKIDRSKDWDV